MTTIVSHNRLRHEETIFNDHEKFTNEQAAYQSNDYRGDTEAYSILQEEFLQSQENQTFQNLSNAMTAAPAKPRKTFSAQPPEMTTGSESETETVTPTGESVAGLTNQRDPERYTEVRERHDSAEGTTMTSTFGSVPYEFVNDTLPLYGDSNEINQEIELFLFNNSDTSQLIRYQLCSKQHQKSHLAKAL